MKILVISDSHSRLTNLERILKKEADCDMIVHLGDGADDLDFCLPYTAHKQIRRVRGNCDSMNCGYLKEQVFTEENVTVFACHGDRYSVYFGLQNLYFAAQSKNARVCLYGHTHVQRADETQDVLLLNPGAVKDGRYALLYLENGSVRSELKTF
jgi:putative phosphoesterase